jgi:hypothetical protein
MDADRSQSHASALSAAEFMLGSRRCAFLAESASTGHMASAQVPGRRYDRQFHRAIMNFQFTSRPCSIKLPDRAIRSNQVLHWLPLRRCARLSARSFPRCSSFQRTAGRSLAPGTSSRDQSGSPRFTGIRNRLCCSGILPTISAARFRARLQEVVQAHRLSYHSFETTAVFQRDIEPLRSQNLCRWAIVAEKVGDKSVPEFLVYAFVC